VTRRGTIAGTPALAASLVLASLVSGCALPGRLSKTNQAQLNCRQLTQRGVAALERGDLEQAETLLAQALQSCPADGEARRHYAEVLWRRGEADQALTQLDQALQLTDEDPALLVRAAEIHLSQDRLAESLALTQQALALDPKSPAAWIVRARVRQRQGELPAALADYHRALACDPRSREVLFEVAELHRAAGDPHRALITLQRLADMHRPGEEPQQVLYLTGLAYSAMRRHEDAADCLRLASERGPAVAAILFRLAEEELLAGRPAAARVIADRLMALDPVYPGGLQLIERTAVATIPGERRSR
jgi:Tfp pilus assembly protein PilF